MGIHFDLLYYELAIPKRHCRNQIHLGSFGQKEFGNPNVTLHGCILKRSRTIFGFCIYLCTVIQEKGYYREMSVKRCIMKRCYLTSGRDVDFCTMRDKHLDNIEMTSFCCLE